MMPQTEGNLFALVPLLLFMALMLAIGVWVRRGRGFGEDFVQQYFIGNRRLGGFVLAMTTVATYSSVSSFVGGPGMAWKVGFGWIYMAVVQVTAIFLVLGIFGKRVAMLSRRFDAVTVVDIIRERFESNGLAMLAALVIVLFFCGTMTAQFVGGARLFAAATGYSYEMGLLLFGLVVVLYTSIGGFRAVALTDTCCALMMMVGIVVLLYYVLAAGGGYEAILSGLHAEHPELFEPLSAGKMPLGLYLTQWILVGICTIALPQSVVRGISYKDTHSLHRAMLIGTVVVGFMNIGVNFTGILAHGVLDGPEASYGSIDNIIPLTIARAVPPELVGLAIIGPLAASISTISGLLIVASSAIVKDVYLAHARAKGRTVADRHLSRLSVVTTAALGVLVFFIALTPPSLIWIINMFAFGGLETAFFWMLLLGLYWRGANRLGALLSMAGGTVAYCAAQAAGFKLMGLHQITIGITVSLVLFLLGARLGRPTSAEVLQVFFPGERGEEKG
ncbi:sodium/pantothenate symporter [Selenomonas sp.]|jgi:sodium/pantothenate symporter|uniref:sodium/pantothenate symporter n=1 Tax=Selenomonas sp. TaxID=2053611 RepID=UPI003A0FD17B